MNSNILQEKNNLIKNLNYLIKTSLKHLSDDKYTERLEIYEFISKQITCPKIYAELNYRITEGENINTLLLEFMYRDTELAYNLYTIKSHLEEFEYYDEFRKFFH